MSPPAAQKKSPALPNGEPPENDNRSTVMEPSSHILYLRGRVLVDPDSSIFSACITTMHPRVSTGGMAGRLRTPLAVVVLADPDQRSPSERDLAVLWVVAGGEPARGRAVGGGKSVGWGVQITTFSPRTLA